MSKIRSMLAALVAVAAGISMPVNVALADTAAYKQLSSEWWQWALSIPADENPLADTTGANCMVGQRGSNWFLAGTFGDTTVIRTCSIPEDATLFFPVINFVGFDTPNACGQDSTPLPSQFYRDLAADFIDGAINLSVSVDGNSVNQLHRVQSKVFWVRCLKTICLPLLAPRSEDCPPASILLPSMTGSMCGSTRSQLALIHCSSMPRRTRASYWM